MCNSGGYRDSNVKRHELLGSAEMFLPKLDFTDPIKFARTGMCRSEFTYVGINMSEVIIGGGIRKDFAVSDQIVSPKSIRRNAMGRWRDLESEVQVYKSLTNRKLESDLKKIHLPMAALSLGIRINNSPEKVKTRRSILLKTCPKKNI